MTLKIITTFKTEIVNSKSERLDVKYFFLNHIFTKLESKSICKVKTLGELNTKISSGSYIDTYINKSKGVPYIRVGNIKPFAIDEREKSFVFVLKNVPVKIRVQKNDIVMGRTQATIEKLGVASIVDEANENFVISQHISKITINSNEVSPYYLIGYLNSKFYKAQTGLATHGVTRVEMTHSQLKEMRVFIPEKNILKSIEEKTKTIVSNNRNAINNIKKAQAILRNKLDIKFDNKNIFFSVNLSSIQNFGIWNGRSHLPRYTKIEDEIKNKFKCVKLGSISIIKKGIEVGSNNYKTELFKKKEDFAFIRTSDITNNEIDIFPDYFVSNKLASTLNNEATNGDIVFSKDGIIGETAIISKYDKVVVASGFAKIKLNQAAKSNNITQEYLFTILSLKETGLIPAIRRTVVASTIPHLREERLKEIEIPILDENSIAKITKLVKEAFSLKDEKKRLIQEVREKIDNYFDI